MNRGGEGGKRRRGAEGGRGGLVGNLQEHLTRSDATQP